MFYVYPNDSATILEAKKEGRKVKMENSKQLVLKLVLLEQ
jgi:hypothetical protein